MNTQAFRRVALAALSVVSVQAMTKPALAASNSTSGTQGGGPTTETADQKMTRDLAKSIIAHLPPASPPGTACDSTARAAIKAAVESTIANAKATPAIAVSAIDWARAKPQHLDSCRDGALADSATESSGSGEVVDEADAVRGFTLYSGVWPATNPSPSSISSVSEPSPPTVTPGAGDEVTAKSPPRRHHRHHRRHKTAGPGPNT